MKSIWITLLTFQITLGAQVMFSGVPEDRNLTMSEYNTEILNQQLQGLQRGDVFIVPNATYSLMGGVWAENIYDVVIQLDGTLEWTDQIHSWPKNEDASVKECWYMQGLQNVTFTSSGAGILEGNGEAWWGYINYWLIGTNRPRMFHIHNSTNLLMEYWHFKQAPRWTTFFHDIADLTIRYSHIDNRRDSSNTHSLYNLGAFNTDGFDVAGKNVHIHDVSVWNQDDCICVKRMDGKGINSQCSENMLFENITASGLGLTVGGIGADKHHSCIRNITFRNCTMHDTYKGIYLKSNPTHGTGEVSNILYENIRIYNAEQWAFWLGPQQAVYPGVCSLLWPYVPFTECPVTANMSWNNLTFRDILIDSPNASPGVILGNSTNPMTNIVFDNVQAKSAWWYPWFSDYYKCEGVVNATAIGGTYPVPPCFEDLN